MRLHRPDAGFNLTELMVVVVIVGIMSAVATPFRGRDRIAREGREFASELARDLTRCRQQAIAERTPIRAFIFSDRVEFRSYVPTRPASPQPTAADPILRVLNAKAGVSVFNVLTAAAAAPGPGPVLTTATSVQVDVDEMGRAQFVGQPALTGAFVYVRNSQLVAGHIERDFRIDVTALSGYVALRDRWN